MQLEPDTTPGHLSVEAGAWWRKLASEYGIVGAGGVALLTLAAEAFDCAQSCRKAIGADLVTRGAKQRLIPHPLLRVEHAARQQMISALRQLNLDIEPLRDRPGRPAGSFPTADRSRGK